MSDTFKSICVYDRVIVGDRSWAVVAVEIGATHQEDAIELVCADGTIPNGQMRVPKRLIPANSIFREVDHEAVKRPAA